MSKMVASEAHSTATYAADRSGAYALRAFLATFPAGYTPKVDTRTPAEVGGAR